MTSLNDIYEDSFFTYSEEEIFEYLEDYDDDIADRIIDELDAEDRIYCLIDDWKPLNSFEDFISTIGSFKELPSTPLFSINSTEPDNVMVTFNNGQMRFTSSSEEPLQRLVQIMLKQGYRKFDHETQFYNGRPVYTYIFYIG